MGRTMRYSVKAGDKWSEVSWFFNAYPDTYAKLVEKWPQTDGTFDFYAMSVRDLCEIYNGGMPSRLVDGITVRNFVVLNNTIKEKMEEFANFLEKTLPPMTEDQKKAQGGLLDNSIEEAILLTCKQYYGLHSLEEAQKLTVYEYMIARKATYNERRYEYNMAAAANARAAASRSRR